MSDHNAQLAEMQGLYGPFTLTERVVQKIWLRADFDRTQLTLVDGRPLEIRTVGIWNLLGGPDFRDARLVIEGNPVAGDIEVHFHVADWRAHQHETDRAYANVALHVVLFPPAPGERPAVRFDGAEIPTLVLLPHLHRDLEEYASDDALEVITSRDAWEKFAGLAATPPAELPGLLRQKARDRWRQKVRSALTRIERVGWQAAAHCTALEILGYRHNRAAMLTVATRFPFETWTKETDLTCIYEESGARWQAQGVRPANHPRARLRQYHAWMAAVPDWPERLQRLAATLPTGEWRRRRPRWPGMRLMCPRCGSVSPVRLLAVRSAVPAWTLWSAMASCPWRRRPLAVTPAWCGFTGSSAMCRTRSGLPCRNWGLPAVAPSRCAMAGRRVY